MVQNVYVIITDFNDIDHLKNIGFKGFKTIAELFQDCSMIPMTGGVYLILNIDIDSPQYLEIGTGGNHKNKNPNVHLEILKENWVEGVNVIYIGKATSLRARLKAYFAFGQGKKAAHYGGRLIWQLANSRSLVVCWNTLSEGIPRNLEKSLIKTFKDKFNKRPFANLRD